MATTLARPHSAYITKRSFIDVEREGLTGLPAVHTFLYSKYLVYHEKENPTPVTPDL